MTWRPIYHPPSDARRNLIRTMSGAASSSAMRIEDQLSEALAWLLDHDPGLALQFARRYVDGDPEALGTLEDVERLGVSTQVRLPPLVPEANHLRPDLSLTGPNRRFQLLVEVKVDADFGPGKYPTKSGQRLDQVAAYIESWAKNMDSALEAKVRRVGTLTVRGDVPPRGAWRAADLRWAEVADLLSETRIAAEVAAVADDLRAFVEGMFGPVVAPPGYLATGSALTKDLADHLAAVVTAPKVSLPHIFQPHNETGYAGGYLAFATPAGDEEQLWITVTATGSDYAPPGEPASLWLCFTDERPPQVATRLALEPLGFQDRTDRAGYRMFRAGLPLEAERLADDVGDVLPRARAWALGLLAEAGFTTGGTL